MSEKPPQMATNVFGKAWRNALDHKLRLLCAAACACIGILTGSLSAMTGTAKAAECPNEAIRVQEGPAAQALPECRAYEMVSPPGSAPSPQYMQKGTAAENGDRFGYFSWNPFPGQDSEATYILATRGATGWTAQGATPPQGGLRNDYFACNPSVYYSANMTHGILSDGLRAGETPCEGDLPELVEGEPRGVGNLFLHDFETGSYTLLSPFPVGGASPQNAYVVDATPDLSDVVFVDDAPLTLEAPGKEARDLYEWAAGTLRLVSFSPEGTPSEGDLANVKDNGTGSVYSTATYTHALSKNGETLFFNIPEGGPLYVRVNAMKPQSKVVAGECTEPALACTTEVDRAEAEAEGPSGGGVFFDASEDGSRVFFTDEHRLTKNSTAVAGKPDLYEYNVQTKVLTDLTVDAAEPADVNSYMGAAEDGSYLYFVADGVLEGVHANADGETATTGQSNLYVDHEGQMTFIAALTPNEGGYGESQWQVSPNGEFLAFNSSRALTGPQDEPAEPVAGCGKLCREIFLYSAKTAEMTCASCPGGAMKPTGPAEVKGAFGSTEYDGPEVRPHYVTDNGTVFFDTVAPLVAQASNGARNVYEYHAGAVHLISTGLSPDPSEFLNASPSGSDVFFTTDEGLVQADTDNADSVYDARIDGGFLAPPGGAEAPACENAEVCKAPLSEPPVRAFGASEAFSGPGDLVHEVAPQEAPEGNEGKGRLTRAEKLKRALKACERKRQARQRWACRRRARERFGSRRHRGKHGGRGRHNHKKRLGARAHRRGHHNKRGGRR